MKRMYCALKRVRWATLLMLLAYMFSGGVASADLTQKQVYELGIYGYDTSVENCSSTDAAGGAIGTGTLPSLIPDPYNSAFTQGAKKYNVAPALVAGIFTEENMTKADPSQLAKDWGEFLNGTYGGFPGISNSGLHNPPGPSGVNTNWPTNQFQTMGAFQFIPSTWAMEGVDGNGDGVKDAQNIWDAAASAANYLASNGATADKPPSSWQTAIFAYNHAQWYVDAVMVYYNFYTTGSTSKSPTGAPAVTAGGCSGSVTVTGNCPVTKPAYSGQYSQSQLAQIFGNPGTADSHPDLHLVTVKEWGFSTQVSPLVASCLDATVKQIQAENVNYKVRIFSCYRFDSNNGTSNIGLNSYHTYGAACDINPDTNPFVESGAPTAHDMPQAFIDAFAAHGFTWGGSWTQPKDYMHFEWHGVVPPS